MPDYSGSLVTLTIPKQI